jgi:hypothetical protein
MAQTSALAPNHSLHPFLLLDSKPAWPTFVATVLHTHMLEVFEKEIKKEVWWAYYNNISTANHNS